MDDMEWLNARFEEHRTRLRTVAYRMLGTRNEADDALQEAWIKISRADAQAVENMGGWLTTVVARVCLDMLRARQARPTAAHLDPPLARAADNPEEDLVMGTSVGLALLVVLEALGPAERVAFVLHDMFDLPFDEIAGIIGRSETATRQLASRARRRVQGAMPVSDADLKRQRAVVEAFLNASRNGDIAGLVAVLDPSVVTRADDAAIQAAASRAAHGAPTLEKESHGIDAAVEIFKGRARVAQAALINGSVGAVWMRGHAVGAVFGFTIEDGKIHELEIILNPERLSQFHVTPFSNRASEVG